MRVGISLLTLSPGDGGGSETYARQLTRALGRVGTHEYMVLVPARAKDAAEGLPAVEVKDPPVAPPRAAPHRDDGPRRAPHEGGDDAGRRVRRPPLPADRALAGNAGADHRHAARHAASRPSRVLRPGPPVVPAHRLRPGCSQRSGGHRDERVRARARRRAVGSRPGPRARRPARDRPLDLPARRRRARADPPVPRATVAAQESHAAPRGVRDAARDAAAAPSRPHGRRPRPARAAPRRRREPRLRLGGAPRLAVPPRGVPRLSQPVRGLRAAGPRGDGVRMSRRRVQRGRDPGGRRRRRRAFRSDRRGRDGRRDARGGQPARGAHDSRPYARRALHVGRECHGATTTSIAPPL